jgi:hypothetical protein
MVVVIVFFYVLGVIDSDFIRIGPNNTTLFMSMHIDTWEKWGFLSFFVFVNTFINSFVADCMGPWITNTVQDHKNLYLPYSKPICLCIVQTYYFYGNIMSMFGLFAMFSQIDFLFIRATSDFIVTYYTTYQFLKSKVFEKEKYEEWFDEERLLS